MRTAVLVLASLATLTLAGCASPGPGHAADRRKVKENLTPELLTLNERHIEVENRLLVGFNTNMRMFWSDLSRASHTDRPSRLTPGPMPH
ncbi:MAG: hypothetical protein HUU18_09925 [Phycisphaerales bacterium]|nr:hypothetical protein [Phycisphaerales bacterium]NUQ68583.1 hypothetical protein [Phycisphaerales bacterium]